MTAPATMSVQFMPGVFRDNLADLRDQVTVAGADGNRHGRWQ